MSVRHHTPGTYEEAELYEVASALGANEIEDDDAPTVTASFDDFAAP